MTSSSQTLVLNSTITKSANLLTEIEIWRVAGFDAMELHASKLESFLDAGFSDDDLRNAFRRVPVVGVGFLRDIERQGPDFESLLSEASRLFELANLVGAPGVQVLTGPVNVQLVIDNRQGRSAGAYSDFLDRPEGEQIAIAAANLAMLADRAAQHGLLLYLEPLSWAPINGIRRSLQLIRAADRPNVKIVIDYWHCLTSGVSLKEIRALDRGLIYGVHVCDSLPVPEGVPIESELRDVPTGQGVLNLKEWTDAVKATGYTGWWAAETFSRRMQQRPLHSVAMEMRQLLISLVGP